MTTVPELVNSSDVVVLNNVFEWFSSGGDAKAVHKEKRAWGFFRDNLKEGAFVVTVPKIRFAWKLLRCRDHQKFVLLRSS